LQKVAYRSVHPAAYGIGSADDPIVDRVRIAAALASGLVLYRRTLVAGTVHDGRVVWNSPSISEADRCLFVVTQTLCNHGCIFDSGRITYISKDPPGLSTINGSRLAARLEYGRKDHFDEFVKDNMEELLKYGELPRIAVKAGLVHRSTLS
jgi:hypothetical protein